MRRDRHREVRCDRLTQGAVGGGSCHVRVQAMADVGRLGAVAGYLGRPVGCRRAGMLNRHRAVAVVRFGHQCFARRTQECESGDKRKNSARPKPSP